MPHRSIVLRLLVYPLSALSCALLYQTGDVAIYYLIGMAAYFWAYSEGEVCPLRFHPEFRSILTNSPQIVCAVPWTLPKRANLEKV
jgi:hypothetical protein